MTYKVYEEYKDSNVDWMGEIPSNWSIQKLKFLSQNFDNKRVPISAGEREEGEFPYYGATGIVDYVNDYIFDEKLLLVGEDGAPFFDENKDVAFLISGKTWVNNHAHVLKINETLILDKLVMHTLNCTDYSLYIKGSTRDKLNQEQLKDIPIIIPPIQEQQKIANYLNKQTAKIDATIAKNEELIQLLEEKRVALINQVVTKGLNPDVPMKDSGVEWIGEIPEHWEIIKGKHIFKIYGNSINEKDVEFDYKDGYKPILFYKVDDMNMDKQSLYMSDNIDYKYTETILPSIPKDSILIPKRGAAIATNKVKITKKNCYIDSNIMALYAPYNSKFYSYFILGRGLWDIADVSTIPQINNKHINYLDFVLPPLTEQDNIVSYLDIELSKNDETIIKIQENINLLEEYKTSLIHHVVTGKIDVRGEEI